MFHSLNEIFSCNKNLIQIEILYPLYLVYFNKKTTTNEILTYKYFHITVYKLSCKSIASVV